MMVSDNELACPRCLALLRLEEEIYHCESCNESYPVDKGIIDLRCFRKDYYFNPVSREGMASLVRQSSCRPWFLTVHDFLNHVGRNPDWLDNLVADGRYAWKIFLQLSEESVLLDLGCGLGNLAKNIAPNVGKVYAMDLTYERLEFARERFKIFNKDDDIVLLAGGDGAHLPFADNTLDFVTLSGVLEWVPDDESLWEGGDSKLAKLGNMVLSVFGKSNPRKMQLEFLKEIRRVLKPGGQVFIGIENRLNYQYFSNRPDHHSGLWYGSLLPRFVANLYSIAIKRRPYRTYTYSISGYSDLLRDAGFSAKEFYGLFSGYSHLSEAIPLKAEDGFWRLNSSGSLSNKIKRNKNLVPAYGIVASDGASNKKTSIISRILMDMCSNISFSGDDEISIADCTVTGKDKVILHGDSGEKSIVIKIPLSQWAVDGEENNYRLITDNVVDDDLLEFVPKALGQGRVENVRYYVEERARGKSLAECLKGGGRTQYIGPVYDLIRVMNPGQGRGKIKLEGEFYQQQVQGYLDKIAAVCPSHELVKEAECFFRDHLYGVEVRHGLVHGDFSVNNIFVCDGNITKLIDWEYSSLFGIPVLDVINYIDSVRRLFSPKKDLVHTIQDLALGRWEMVEEEKLLEECCRYFGLDSEEIKWMACIYWLHHVGNQLNGPLIYDIASIDKRIVRSLELIVKL